ncbi:hypothetical protein TNCT_656431 [Trichonephila clavata]|uniref:Uncharacterized protein n=1 Tax=Trichonephila clavata TaxID=2740835 RepID=A0A8X6F4S5_TRICU|nr:hypothetical protein TNCT_656431 [Trichonephila clavata]
MFKIFFQETVHTVFTTRNSEIFEGSHVAQTSSAQQWSYKKHECPYCHKICGTISDLIIQYVEEYSAHRNIEKGGRSSAPSPQRLTARHFPSLVPSTGNKKRAAQRRCFVCQHTTKKPQKRAYSLVLNETKLLSEIVKKTHYGPSTGKLTLPLKGLKGMNLQL